MSVRLYYSYLGGVEASLARTGTETNTQEAVNPAQILGVSTPLKWNITERVGDTETLDFECSLREGDDGHIPVNILSDEYCFYLAVDDVILFEGPCTGRTINFKNRTVNVSCEGLTSLFDWRTLFDYPMTLTGTRTEILMELANVVNEPDLFDSSLFTSDLVRWRVGVDVDDLVDVDDTATVTITLPDPVTIREAMESAAVPPVTSRSIRVGPDITRSFQLFADPVEHAWRHSVHVNVLSDDLNFVDRVNFLKAESAEGDTTTGFSLNNFITKTEVITTSDSISDFVTTVQNEVFARAYVEPEMEIEILPLEDMQFTDFNLGDTVKLSGKVESYEFDETFKISGKALTSDKGLLRSTVELVTLERWDNAFAI